MTNTHIPHKDIAYHIDWNFREEALLRIGNQPTLPNFYPLSDDLRKWLLRQGQLRILSRNRIPGQSFTNPYTYNASVLSLVYADVVNDSADFIASTESIDPLDAEIRSIRLQTDTILYPARLCEVLIKQLLHLTTFPENYYRRAALGALLSKDCAGCRSSNNTPHKVSLLGSLAHRYRLCFDFEDCLKEHLELVKHRRDVEAAHAGITKLTGKSLVAVRKGFEKEFTKHTKIFIHMLEHISEIEDKMFWELRKKLPPDFKIIFRTARKVEHGNDPKSPSNSLAEH